MDVFVSYSDEDIGVATKMCGVMKLHGITYWAKYETEGGDSAEKVFNLISNSIVLLVFVSTNSNESKQVMNEINCASMCGKPLLPVVIDDVEISPAFEYYISGSNRLGYSQSGEFAEQFVAIVRSMIGADALPEEKEAVTKTSLKAKAESKGKKKKIKIIVSVVAFGFNGGSQCKVGDRKAIRNLQLMLI